MRRLALLLFAVLPLLQAQTPQEMEARLEQEVAALNQARDEQLTALRAQYLGALQGQLPGVQAEADRQALQEEIRRVQTGETLRPAGLSGNARVRHFQEILLQQIDRVEAPRRERIGSLVERLQAFAQNQGTEEWTRWGAGLPARFLEAGMGVGGKTRFLTMLEAGERPYLIVLGNSTSEYPNARIDAPWVQCAPGTRANWPGVLSPQLRNLGNLRLGGNTCAGATSSNFIDGSGRHGDNRFRQLDWLVEQNPDAVIIEFAVGTDSVDRFNISAAESRANHETIIQALRANNPQVEIFLLTGAKSFNDGRRSYADDRSGRNRAASNDTQADYANMLIDLARASGPGVYVVDTFALFSEIYEREGLRTYRTFFRDGNHTNQRGGQEVIVPEILRVFEQGNP